MVFGLDPRVKPLFLPVGGLCLSMVWVKAQPIRVHCYLGKSVARGLTLHVFFNVFVSLFSLGYPFTQRIYFMSVRRGLLRRGVVGVIGFGKHRLTAYFRSVWPRQESTPCTKRSGAWLPVFPSGCRFMYVSSMGRQVFRVQKASCLKYICLRYVVLSAAFHLPASSIDRRTDFRQPHGKQTRPI